MNPQVARILQVSYDTMEKQVWLVPISVATAIADSFQKKSDHHRNKIAKILTIFVKIDEAEK